MTLLVLKNASITAMSIEDINVVATLEAESLKKEQVHIDTSHMFHAGMYARTIKVPAGVLLTGALIKIPTLLIFNGDADVFIGRETVHLTGYQLIRAEAHRKQAFLAYKDTYLTMIFQTEAASVDEAEREFTDEWEKLMTRKEK